MYYFILLGEIYIELLPEDKQTQAGKDVVFQCGPDADTLRFGRPEIHWYKDDDALKMTTLRSTERGKQLLKYLNNKHDGSLTIFNVSSADSGRYTCVASLYEETDTASATLLVEGKISIFHQRRSYVATMFIQLLVHDSLASVCNEEIIL